MWSTTTTVRVFAAEALNAFSILLLILLFLPGLVMKPLEPQLGIKQEFTVQFLLHYVVGTYSPELAVPDSGPYAAGHIKLSPFQFYTSDLFFRTSAMPKGKSSSISSPDPVNAQLKLRLSQNPGPVL